MKRRPLVLGAAAFAAAVLPNAAEAGNPAMCLSQEVNVFGTKGNDEIRVSADEAGARASINGGPWRKVPGTGVSIDGKAGKDKITFSSDGGGGAVICGGDGDDRISGTMLARVHGGGGYDKVETYLQCDYIRPEFFATEVVRITGFDSVEEGPCN